MSGGRPHQAVLWGPHPVPTGPRAPGRSRSGQSSPLATRRALRVTRTAAGGTGKGFFHVGNHEADSLAFSFSNFPDTVPIMDIRAVVGTASGEGYRASVYLLDFQIWA